MRAMWAGTITFGLVSIPVNIYTATDRESGPELNYVHADCGQVTTQTESGAGRVSVRYQCKQCGEYFTQGQLNKGIQHGDTLITLSADEIDSLNGVKCRNAEVLEFVDVDEIPVELYGSLYYVAPIPPKRASRSSALSAPITRSYQLLVETLRRTGLVALVNISLRNREHRAILSVSGDVLSLRMLLWTAQVRDRAFDGWDRFGGMWPAEELTVAEVDQAAALVQAMRGKFDPDSHVDPYATRLAELIDTKAAALVSCEPVPDNVTPLFAELKRAVAG